jgi:hypothetical protein
MPVVMASLSGQFGRHRYIEAWRMTIHCVKTEKRVITLKDILFKTLYGWIVITNSSRSANFVEFMDMCLFFMYLGCTHLCFNTIDILIIIIKK